MSEVSLLVRVPLGVVVVVCLSVWSGSPFTFRPSLLVWSRKPFGKPTDPIITSISVEPPEKVLARQGRVQLKVTAHYSDGHAEDVTRMTRTSVRTLLDWPE